MKLEREIYNLLLRKLTNPYIITDVVSSVPPCQWITSRIRTIGGLGFPTGSRFKWKKVLKEDVCCNAAKCLLNELITEINEYWIDSGDFDEFIGCGDHGNYTEVGTIKNCTRLKELLILAEFHSTLINNNEIVDKLNIIITIIKDQNIWKEQGEL